MYSIIAYRGQDTLYYFEGIIKNLRNEVNAAPENEILNVGESQYIEYLVDQYTPDYPEVDLENAYVDDGSILRAKYIIPYSGEINLLQIKPSTYLYSTSNNLQQINFNDNNEMEFDLELHEERQIAGDITRFNSHFGQNSNYQNLHNEFIQFEARVRREAESAFKSRKELILNKRNLLASVPVKVKKKVDSDLTFAAPSPARRKKIVVKPRVTSSGFVPEPVLDEASYHEVLRTINDVGKNFERYPSTTKDRGEEALRDNILLTLAPSFEGGTAGAETFNSKGKTDILLSYESSVLFVAECKFWTGPAGYLGTIDQLLSYLTWRNSKTSAVMFVPNKDMTNVVNQISEVTSKHEAFVGEKEKAGEGWFNFVMRLPKDPQKEIDMAVQLFHIVQDE